MSSSFLFGLFLVMTSFLQHIQSNQTGKGDFEGDFEVDFEDEDDDANQTLDFEMLIAGGFHPTDHTFEKYAVSIRTSQPTAYFGDNHFCAGTLIRDKVILTAAHCVVDSNKLTMRPSRLLVVMGTPNRLHRDQNSVLIEVETVVPHKEFERGGSHDIAMLFLKDAIPRNNSAIEIISLASDTPPTNTICTAIGWGQLFTDGPYSAHAVYVHMHILKKEICVEKYKIFGENMICAANPNDWGDMCRGDSGGPLICNEELAGIVSWGSNCVELGFPTVFTDVSQYRNWIQEMSGAMNGVCTSVGIVVLGVLLTCIL